MTQPILVKAATQTQCQAFVYNLYSSKECNMRFKAANVKICFYIISEKKMQASD
jgi:hypothetical protein